jgi:hypothetical protein
MNQNFNDDFNMRLDKDGISLILIAALQNAFFQSSQSECIQIYINLTSSDEDRKELSLSILQFDQNSGKGRNIFAEYYSNLDSEGKAYYPNFDVCRRVAQQMQGEFEMKGSHELSLTLSVESQFVASNRFPQSKQTQSRTTNSGNSSASPSEIVAEQSAKAEI